jgi:mannose-6-phosphate isomerase-like protein (cupin superfamily)
MRGSCRGSGEFRQLTEAIGASQLAVTFVRVPAHTDFERGTGHIHEEIEELYLVTRGTLTMRCGEDVLSLRAPAAVRVDPQTPRSHRNEGDEPVEMWAVSRWIARSDLNKDRRLLGRLTGGRQTRLSKRRARAEGDARTHARA